MIDVYYREEAAETLQIHHIAFDVSTKDEARVKFNETFGPGYIITRCDDPAHSLISCFKNAVERYYKNYKNESEYLYYKDAMRKHLNYTDEELTLLELEWAPKRKKRCDK